MYSLKMNITLSLIEMQQAYVDFANQHGHSLRAGNKVLLKHDALHYLVGALPDAPGEECLMVLERFLFKNKKDKSQYPSHLHSHFDLAVEVEKHYAHLF